jgi:acyl carrier protein
MNRSEIIATDLAGLIEELTGRRLPLLLEPAAAEVSLWNLGLTSSDAMRLLSAVEDRFGVRWSLDDSSDALSSFGALVAHVAEHATTVPTGEDPR